MIMFITCAHAYACTCELTLQVLVLSVARLLFVPAYIFCTMGPLVLTRHDEAPVFLLTLALGATSGAYATLALMSAPKAVTVGDGEQASAAVVLFLILGLTTGAAAGWLWLVST